MKIASGLDRYNTRNPITQINIRLASPEQIKEWCSRIIPQENGDIIIGKIKSAQTVDYKTLDPKKDGLFCERVFGPVKDFQCFCQKKKNLKHIKESWRFIAKKKIRFCSLCKVEYASARVRRYNLGYIQLNSPVTHIWFLKGRISYLSVLLGYKRRYLEELTICERVLEFTKNKTKNSFLFSPTFFKEKTTYNTYNTSQKSEKESDLLDTNFFLTLTSKIRFSSEEKKKTSCNNLIRFDRFYKNKIHKPFSFERISKGYGTKRGKRDHSLRSNKQGSQKRKEGEGIRGTKRGKRYRSYPFLCFNSKRDSLSRRGSLSRRDSISRRDTRKVFFTEKPTGGTKRGKRYRSRRDTRDTKHTRYTRYKKNHSLSSTTLQIPEKSGTSYSNLFKSFAYTTVKTKIGRKTRKRGLRNQLLIQSICARKDMRDHFYGTFSSFKSFYKKPVAVLAPYRFSLRKRRESPFTRPGLPCKGTPPSLYPFLRYYPLKRHYPLFKDFKKFSFGDLIQDSKKTRIEIPPKKERIVQSFFQPTLCPFLPEVIAQVVDFRLDLKKQYTFDEFNNPIWCDRWILMFFTVLPETGDLPIPEYSQLTGYSENNFLQYEFYLTPLLFHQKQVVNTGGFVIKEMLKQLNLLLLGRILKRVISRAQKQINETRQLPYPERYIKRRLRKLKIYHFKKVRCAKITRDFLNSKVRPEWMTLSTLPVLPPNLRPIIRLDGNNLAVSDLNKIYQTIIYRNNRIDVDFQLQSQSLKKQALLQKAVDALIDNGKGGKNSMCALNGRPLKSLSDILKGKKGRFRLTLLGKRVDYSGRSVIVVGPTLKVHQCGLPKEMAIELFQPFLIRYFIKQKRVKTIVSAKYLINKKDFRFWPVLEKIMRKHFVFLNRAPTLHRLGIQGFQPRLVNGRAILLHPLVCTAFNADFDGDQMAVHIPLSLKAQAEARILMSPLTNILSPATGQPVLVPSQDMILGCNYLTYLNLSSQKNYINRPLSLSLPIKEKPNGFPFKAVKKKKAIPSNTEGSIKAGILSIPSLESSFSISSQTYHTGYFSDFNDLLKAYYQKKIDLHAPAWVRTNLSIETEKSSLSPLEMRISSFGEYNQLFSTYRSYYNRNNQKIKQYLFTTPGRVLINQIFFA